MFEAVQFYKTHWLLYVYEENNDTLVVFYPVKAVHRQPKHRERL